MKKADELIQKARLTNEKRDKLDKKLGFAPPTECAVDNLLRTAMCAINCGLNSRNGDMDAIAEGYVMLEQVHESLTGLKYELGEKP